MPQKSNRTKYDTQQIHKFDRSNTPDYIGTFKESYCVTCHDKTIDRRGILEENNKHNMTLAGI